MNHSSSKKANSSSVKKHKPNDAKKGKKSASNGCIADNTICSIHSKGKHTWGDQQEHQVHDGKKQRKPTKKAKTDDKPMVYNVNVKSDNNSYKSNEMAKNNVFPICQQASSNIT